MSLRCTFNRLMGGFIFFAILAIGQGVSADIIDDFEEVFVPQGTFGQIPTGWTVIGSNTVKYSKGNEAYNGLYGLHANATRYSEYYGVLVKEAFNTGYSNETIHFSIHAKAQTSGECSFALAITSDGTTTNNFLYWDSNSETDWRTAELDIDIPQSGEVEIALKFGHDTPTGSSTIDVDYLTFCFLESIYYRDVDGDGFGDPSDTTQACEQPEGYVLNNNDQCDDDPGKQEPGLCGCGIPDSVNDSDNDGTADCIDSDDDNDGLSDVDEEAYGTDPYNPDTDNDSLSDGMEVGNLGTNPLMVDSDSDGIPDIDEDSDGDGLTNSEEIECESDPACPSFTSIILYTKITLLLD